MIYISRVPGLGLIHFGLVNIAGCYIATIQQREMGLADGSRSKLGRRLEALYFQAREDVKQ